MRALVTGATGFIGSYVARQLVQDGVKVGALIRPGSDTWRIADIIDRIDVLSGDLRDCRSAVQSFAPTVAIHLAWHGVTNDQRNALTQIEHNLQPTLDLVRLCGESGCRAFVGLGSQAEYGPQDTPIGESAPVRPTTLYGAVKLSAGLLCEHLARNFNMRFAWVRVFSTYGPGDNPSWLIPYLTLELLAGRTPRLTAGEQIWDYLHVEDAARAVCAVAAAEQAAGVFNLGSGEGRPLRDIIVQLRDRIAPGRELGFGEIPYRPDQVMHLVADIGRLQRVVGWRPVVSLEAGLAGTVEWFRDFSNKNMPTVSV